MNVRMVEPVVGIIFSLGGTFNLTGIVARLYGYKRPEETWIGISANLHLASSSENCFMANDLALWTIQQDGMTEALKVDGDQVAVPDKPGLGTGAEMLFKNYS